MKPSNIKTILEEQINLDDSMQVSTSLNGSFSSTYSKKRSSMYKSQIYQQYLKKDFDFTQDEDLQIIFEIMQKQNHSKTIQDLMILQHAFKNIKLFQELADQIPQKQLFNLYKELLHYEYQSRQVVFNQGEIGSVYIIGNEDKTTQNNETTAQSNNEEKKQQNNEDNNSKQLIQDHDKWSSQVQTTTSQIRKKQSTFHQYKKNDSSQTLCDIQQSITFSRQNTIQNKGFQCLNNLISCTTSYTVFNDYDDEEYIKQVYPNFDILAKLEAGSSFGEVALKDSVPRTATVICSGETHFITLKRDAFKKFLEQYYSVVQSQNISFVKKISLFSNWTDQMVNQMFYFLEKQTFRMNQTIYKEGSLPLGAYLIKQGEIKLYQEMQLQSSGKHDKLKGLRHFLRQQETPKNLLFQAPVSHIAEEQLFGHEDIVNQTPRKYTAICSSSSCTVLFLNKDKFIQFSKRRNTLENAIEESAIKNEWHQKILSKFESFSKNYHEFNEMIVLKQQKRVNEKQNANKMVQSKKQINRINSIQKGLNRSMPAMNKSNTQQSFNQITPDLIAQDMIMTQSIVQIPQFQDENIDLKTQDEDSSENQQKMSSSQQMNNKMNNSVQYKIEPPTIIKTEQNLQTKKISSNSLHQLTVYSPTSYENFQISSQQSKRLSNYSLESSMKIQQSLNDSKLKESTQKTLTEISTKSQSYFSPQSQKQQMIKTINSPFLKSEQSPQINFSHKRFLSQSNENQHKFIELNNYHEKNLKQTIRKQGIQKDKLQQEIEESVRFPPRRLHKSLHYSQDNSLNNSNEYTVQHKLDLDNQLIPVCSQQLLSSKRGECQRNMSQSKVSPQFLSPQMKELYDQKRILQSLKLPKVHKNTFNLKEIFNNPSSETLKSSNQSLICYNENIQEGSELKDNINQQQTDNNINRQNKSNSIIETLNQMRMNIINKQTIPQSQNERNEKQITLTPQSNNSNIKRQTINNTPIQTIQKQPFKIQNFSMNPLDKFCNKIQLSYQPTTNQTKQNQIPSINI